LELPASPAETVRVGAGGASENDENAGLHRVRAARSLVLRPDGKVQRTNACANPTIPVSRLHGRRSFDKAHTHTHTQTHTHKQTSTRVGRSFHRRIDR
jgi:hypothetical protein